MPGRTINLRKGIENAEDRGCCNLNREAMKGDMSEDLKVRE